MDVEEKYLRSLEELVVSKDAIIKALQQEIVLLKEALPAKRQKTNHPLPRPRPSTPDGADEKAWVDLVRQKYPEMALSVNHSNFAHSFCSRHGLVGLTKSSRGRQVRAIPQRCQKQFMSEFDATFPVFGSHNEFSHILRARDAVFYDSLTQERMNVLQNGMIDFLQVNGEDDSTFTSKVIPEHLSEAFQQWYIQIGRAHV